MSSSNTPPSETTLPDHRWAERTVAVVADFDSFLRAGAAFAANLSQRGASVRYVLLLARARQVSRDQLTDMGIDPGAVRLVPMGRAASRAMLDDVDVVVLSASGLRTRRFLLALHRVFIGAQRRPVVVSLYPGLIFRFHLEGMTSRMAADLLVLNSPHDLATYSNALEEMGLLNANAICGGLSFLPAASDGPRAIGETVVFVAQPTVPATAAERRYVLRRLLELARRHPETPWVLKPRHRRGETTLHRDDHHFEDLLADERDAGTHVPPNFQVVHGPMSEVLANARLCLTFSSTAALEALQLRIPTRILTDVGINENIGNHFFVGSGLACTLDDVRPDMGWRAPRPDWWDANVVTSSERLPATLARLEELLDRRDHANGALPAPYPRLFGGSPGFERHVTNAAGLDGDERKPLSAVIKQRFRWLRSNLVGLRRAVSDAVAGIRERS